MDCKLLWNFLYSLKIYLFHEQWTRISLKLEIGKKKLIFSNSFKNKLSDSPRFCQERLQTTKEFK